MTLDKLSLNTTGYIKKLRCNNTVKRRLLDLGLIENTPVTPILISPSGDPKAFQIRGSLIAIRIEDTSLIDISLKTITE